MGRGPKKHMKRIAAPKHWNLDKLGGYWAPRPRSGAHKLRECVPLILIIRNRLKFALTRRETNIILEERNVLVDGKVKRDMKYPAGFMDVITLPKIGRSYRVLMDTIGRFQLIKITKKEANFKLVKVTKIMKLRHGYPAVGTSDGRVIRFAPPGVKIADSLKITVPDQKIVRVVPFKVGALVMASVGRNSGRIGEILKIEKHQATFDIVYCKDIKGHLWTTRKDNVFVIGEDSKSFVSLPKEKGVKLDPVEFRRQMMKQFVEKRKKKSKDGFSMAQVRESIRKKRQKSRKKGKVVEEEAEEVEKAEFFEYLKFKGTRRKAKKKVVKEEKKKMEDEKKE